MLRSALTSGLGTSRKTAFLNITILANAIVWYFLVYGFLQEIIVKAGFNNASGTGIVIIGVNIVGVAVSAIACAFVSNRIKQRLPLLRYWMLAGALISLVPIAINISSYIVLLIFSASLGVYFGIGMPVCFGFFAASTEPENRGRLSGITFLVTSLWFVLLNIVGFQNVFFTALILSAWRAAGLSILLLTKPTEVSLVKSSEIRFSQVLTNKPFLLYFIPWCMFMVLNYMVVPVANKILPAYLIDTPISDLIICIVAVVGGFTADTIGRKRLIVLGFVLAGLGYAVLGLFPTYESGWYFYVAVDCLAWGIFYTLLLITIWGDLANGLRSEKFYALGSLPFLLSVFMRLSLGAYVADNLPDNFFSFASFFLFIAVLPLFYAPETLAEKRIRELELKNYIKRAEIEKRKYS